MRYDLAKLPIATLFVPVSAATAALTRLDERIARSPLRDGWIARSHFGDAVASLWVDGELVHLEDLVLHDASMGVRAPTHELTIAHDVLRTRRRILANEPGWALSNDGVLRGRMVDAPSDTGALVQASGQEDGLDGDEDDDDDPLAKQLAEMDAVLARSEALMSGVNQPMRTSGRDRNPFVYEPDWDEESRLDEWRSVLAETEALPPVLRAVLLLDAWDQLQVLQHAPWLGRMLAGALLRETGICMSHLVAVNLGLKQVQRERRASRDRDTRLLAFVDAFKLAAELGLKEHDRLLLARQQMQHRLAGRRTSSKLPQLIELVLARPMVSAGMIAEELGVTTQGALKIAAALNLRELTGRGRFRAWGVL
uniref:RHE_PE00001 family protein n=1 Tax=uncultured Rhizobium sp. TaxID=155567 RepID=UPI00262C9848|nr:RHE_PE00001 family protein [uncultured Rhizobium sp.]